MHIDNYKEYSENIDNDRIIVYHVTRKENLESILEDGLLPKTPEDFPYDDEAVYVFPTREDMTTAMGQWLGDRIDEWEEENDEEYGEIELVIDVTGLKSKSDVEYELAILEPITPNRILEAYDDVYDESEMGLKSRERNRIRLSD